MARGRTGSRGRGRKTQATDAPPDVYREMLAELGPDATSRPQGEGLRPGKRRRVGRGHPPQREPSAAPRAAAAVEIKTDKSQASDDRTRNVSPEPELQLVDFNPEASSDGSHDSDEFENVDLFDSATVTAQLPTDAKSFDGGASLNLTLGASQAKAASTSRKRRAITHIVDKQLILPTHKLHILCLLSHLSLRNHWCNDEQVHRLLRKLVPRKAREEIEDDPTEDQYTRDQKLRSGLRQAISSFEDKFSITARGLRRSWWDARQNEVLPPSLEDLDVIASISDFRDAARSRTGSRDVAAQLFCAMLRGLGLSARLVFSVQPLPLNGGVRPQAPSPHAPAYVVRYDENRTGLDSEKPARDEPAWQASAIRRRLGGGATSAPQSTTLPKTPLVSQPALVEPTRLKESPQPIFWAEVFNPAYQKWVPIDAVTTHSLGQPSKLEPAQKDIRNSLSYVVGMEEDGSLRDVTRRYASQFNAKTRKTRIDRTASAEGSQWWQRILRLYRRPIKLARDEIEDAEMQRREEREGMPRNIEDFKGHPLYVLERHLRRNEVIQPRREVGRTGAGKLGDEAVYRRRDVHAVKSADAWYRVGREIKVGEQPMKIAAPKRKAPVPALDSDDNSEEEASKGLYAVSQTRIFTAPPVKNGRVPRNAFGNLDVYVPSMIPPGAVHLVHPNTKHAAKLLEIDFVDAVTGFEFRGRQGSAVIKGAVVAAEYKDAVLEVLYSMASEKAAAEAEKLQRESLRLWRRFMIGLRIKERVAGYADNDEEEEEEDDDSEYKMSSPASNLDEAMYSKLEGGFLTEEPTGAVPDDTFQRSLAVSAFDLSSRDFTVVEGPKIPDISMKSIGLSDQGNSSAVRKDSLSPQDSAEGGGFMTEASGGFVLQEADGFVYDRGDHFPNEEAGISTVSHQGTEPQGSVSSQTVVVPDLPTISRDSDHTDRPANTPPVVEVGDTRFAKPAKELSSREKQNPNCDSAADGSKGLQRRPSEHSSLGSLISEDPEDAEADPDWLA